MELRRNITRFLANAGYFMMRKTVPAAYAQDGLFSVHSHAFMREPAFKRAYARGVEAIGGSDDYKWHWRIHIGLWAAFSASKLDGDFVECGVNKGFLSSAIMQHLNWDSLNKQFYLLDTFSGLDDRFVSDVEIRKGALKKNVSDLQKAFYSADIDAVRKNFAQWQNVCIIQGAVPLTLERVDSRKIAYLHLDMNCAPPEIAAINHFWPRLVPGAMILLDDYAYFGYEAQKHAMDAFAAERNLQICSLPTGQGLLIKPPNQATP